MFISLTRPQGDMVFSGDNVFAPAACAPWPFSLTQFNAAQTLNQPRLHDMPFSPASSKGGLPDAGLGQQRQQQEESSAYNSAYYRPEPQAVGENVLLPTVRYGIHVSLFEEKSETRN